MQVYPLFAAVGVAVGICGFSLARNICINPEVRYSSSTLSICVCFLALFFFFCKLAVGSCFFIVFAVLFY